MKIELIDLAAMVDELASLKAMIAPLQERETAIKDLLKATGRDRIAGTEHDAVISISEPENLDRKRLRSDLGESIWATYLLPSKIVLICKLTARKVH